MRTRYRCNDPRDPHYEPELRYEVVTVPCPVCGDDKELQCWFRGGEWKDIETPARCLDCGTLFTIAQRRRMEDQADTIVFER